MKVKMPDGSRFFDERSDKVDDKVHGSGLMVHGYFWFRVHSSRLMVKGSRLTFGS